jgi:hypothetical protein
MSSFSPSFAFLLLFGAAACGGASATPAPSSTQASDKYPIVLQRDLEAGKTYRISIKDESQEQAVMRVQGKVVSDESKSTLLSFVGTQKPLSPGRDQPAEYVVEEMTRTLAGQTAALLPAGSKIAAKPVDKKWHYAVEGQAMTEELDEALHTLFGDEIGGPSDDDLFGSKVPRAIGESWNLDISHFQDENVKLHPEGATGSTRLLALRKIDGVDCLEIQADLSVPRVTLNGLPEGTKLLEARMSGNFLGMFPTDGKRPSLSQGMSMDMKMKMEVPSPNGPVLAEMIRHDERTANRQ